jgi:hypothetical protein
MDMPDLDPRSPFRPPWWRWGLAREHRRTGRLPARLDDRWVRRARRVLSTLDESGGDLDHPRVTAVDPAVAGAYGLHSVGDARLRIEVEARLLAGQDDAAIASRVGLGIDDVGAYDRLFFDVREHLERTDWIAAVVFGPRLFDGTGAGDLELAARLVGYNLGPVALDVHFGRPTEPIVDPTSVAESLRHYVAAATAPVTLANAPRWLALAGRIGELGREAVGSGAAAVCGPVLVPGGVAAVRRPDCNALTAYDQPGIARPDNDPVPLAGVLEVPAVTLERLLARRIA